MNELIEKFNDMDVTYILSENKDDMYLDTETIAKVFNTSRQNITYHLNQLDDSKTFANNSCKSQIKVPTPNSRPKTYYNLDVVIEIGYRVKSPQAREFRNWANNILKQYMLAPVRVPMVERLADAMNVDKVEQAERIKELEGQVLSLSMRIGNQRALEKEVVQLKEEVARSNIEIADLYGQLSTMKGNYWKRELEKVQSYVNHSLDEWK